MANWFTKGAGNFWKKFKSAFWDATRWLWDDANCTWDAVGGDPWETGNNNTWETKN